MMKRYAVVLALPLVLLGLSCNQRLDGGVYRSFDSGETWEQAVVVSTSSGKAQSLGDADIISLVFHPEDPNIIYLGTKASGLFLTLTGGETWVQSEKITTGYIGAIATDPVDPTNVYMAQDSAILKSTDEGLTWQTVYSDVDGATITALAVDSFEHSRVYAGTSTGTVYKSSDYGVHWDLRQQTGDSIKRLAIAAHDTRIVYVLTTDGTLYKSVTGGEPISEADADTVNSGWGELLDREYRQTFDDAAKVFDLSIDVNDSSIIYLVTRRGIMKGEADGTNWSDVLTLVGVSDKQNDEIRNVNTAPSRPNEMYFTLNNVVHKSIDGGNTWTVIENFPSQRKIYRLIIDPQTPNVLYAGMFKIEEQGGLIKQPN